MHLTLYLPGLVWPHAAASGQIPKKLPTQVMDKWLRFGNIQQHIRKRSDLYRSTQSYQSLLAHCQQQIGKATEHAFLVSPVLQRVDLHSMSISDGSVLNITMAEAHSLCQDINDFLQGDTFHFEPVREYLWLVTSKDPVTWNLPPVCDIEGQLKFMPRPHSNNAKDSAKIQTLQAELQMLLSQHPVNKKRQKNKASQINGLWFWRDLQTQTPLSADIPLMTDAPLLTDSATLQTDAPYDWYTAYEWLQQNGTPNQAVLWLNTLEAPTMFGDIWGYQDGFEQLNTHFFQPIQDALKVGTVKQLTIKTDGYRGFDLDYRRRDTWAFWKRGHGFMHYLETNDAS